MLQIPYLFYFLALKNKLKVKEILEMSNSTSVIIRDAQTYTNSTYSFIGEENEYLEFLIDTALLKFRNISRVADTEDSTILTFFRRFVL